MFKLANFQPPMYSPELNHLGPMAYTFVDGVGTSDSRKTYQNLAHSVHTHGMQDHAKLNYFPGVIYFSLDLAVMVWFQNRRAKFRKLERSHQPNLQLLPSGQQQSNTTVGSLNTSQFSEHSDRNSTRCTDSQHPSSGKHSVELQNLGDTVGLSCGSEHNKRTVNVFGPDLLHFHQSISSPLSRTPNQDPPEPCEYFNTKSSKIGLHAEPDYANTTLYVNPSWSLDPTLNSPFISSNFKFHPLPDTVVTRYNDIDQEVMNPVGIHPLHQLSQTCMQVDKLILKNQGAHGSETRKEQYANKKRTSVRRLN
ncbi:hypothetical protein AHF37_01091 [Paragonimus kellicotti]|nr:hypothetical protein AHF37_01091 [Paragonimus kellicotti]